MRQVEVVPLSERLKCEQRKIAAIRAAPALRRESGRFRQGEVETAKRRDVAFWLFESGGAS